MIAVAPWCSEYRRSYSGRNPTYLAVPGRSRAPLILTLPSPPSFAPLHKLEEAPHTHASYTVRVAFTSSIQWYQLHAAASRRRQGPKVGGRLTPGPPWGCFLTQSKTTGKSWFLAPRKGFIVVGGAPRVYRELLWGWDTHWKMRGGRLPMGGVGVGGGGLGFVCAFVWANRRNSKSEKNVQTGGTVWWL